MKEKEMIEEMANIIDERLIEANNVLGSMNKGKGYWLAQKLVEYYQPKLPKGAVVLSKEEYKNDFCSQFNKGYKIARKETAKEFATTLISVLWEEEKDEKIRIKDVHGVIRDILNSEYGVEVQEK